MRKFWFSSRLISSSRTVTVSWDVIPKHLLCHQSQAFSQSSACLIYAVLNLVIERIFIDDIEVINCREHQSVLCNRRIVRFGLYNDGMDRECVGRRGLWVIVGRPCFRGLWLGVSAVGPFKKACG